MGGNFSSDHSPDSGIIANATSPQSDVSTQSEGVAAVATRHLSEEEQRIKLERRQKRLEQKRQEQEEEKRVFAETVFESLDLDQSGFVELADLQAWIETEPYFKTHMCQTSAESLLNTLDRDCDGRVCQEEFVRVFSRLKDIDKMTEHLLLHKLEWDALSDEGKRGSGSGVTVLASKQETGSSATAAVATAQAKAETDEKPSKKNAADCHSESFCRAISANATTNGRKDVFRAQLAARRVGSVSGRANCAVLNVLEPL